MKMGNSDDFFEEFYLTENSHGLDGCTLFLIQAFHKLCEHLLPISFAGHTTVFVS